MNRLRRDWVVDLLVCVAIVGYALPPMLDPNVNDPRATLVGPLMLPLLLAPIFVRRRHPLAAAGVFAAGCVISGTPTFAQFRLVVVVPVAVLVAYSLATRCAGRRAVLGLGLVLSGVVFVGATESVVHGVRGAVSMAAFAFPICLAVWGAGRVVASREEIARRLADRSEQLRRQREMTAALAVEIDRERLAADLDLAVRARLQEIVGLASVNGADVGTRFSRIEVLARESLDRMRMLLGLLRAVDRGARAPRPTLAQLDGLLAGARSGGRVVDLQVEGDRRPLTAGVELAAYRTLQHALAATGGGGDGRATVVLRYHPDQLELEVHGSTSRGTLAGAALMAARERVLVLGGRFSSDDHSPRDRVVRAWLPVSLDA